MKVNHDKFYVERHFWSLAQLARAVGESTDRVESLILAGCAPGPVYVLGSGGWWSALDREQRRMPTGQAWYSPGAAWGLRRAILAVRGGASDQAAALLLERRFCDAFVGALQEVKGAELAFPGCFDRGALDPSAARTAASGEWASWRDGGYAVCLRVFTGRSCVSKETLGATLKAALARGDYDPVRLLGLAEALAEIMLPFAPWQRASGTPGLTIDRLLDEQRLGTDQSHTVDPPSGDARAVDREFLAITS